MRVPDNRKSKRGKGSEDGRREVQIVKGYRNLEDLKTRISKYSTIVKKDDCLGLPPKIYQTYYVELTDEQKRAYESMRKKSIIELESTIVTSRIVLTKLLRLHQIVCGFIVDDDKNLHEIPSNRVKALEEILDECPDKAIVWANYRHSIQGIEKSLGELYGPETVRSYYGDTTKDEREEIKQLSRRGVETDVRWLISNQASGGYGNTWTNYNTVVYFANCFDGELRNQSEDRAHRIGQTKSVTYVDIVAKDTVDEKIISTLKSKKDLSSMITPGNWQEWF
jgi:SNF2 family DNA or RNA helicase